MMSLDHAASFFDYLNERESVRLRKEAGDFFPWTEDKILQTYKFTNVRRQHDKTSMMLRELFYKEHFNDNREAILLNCATFRYFGTYEFATEIGWTDWEDFTDVHWENVKETAADRLSNRERVFTGAYVITNQGISAPKQEVVVDYFRKSLQTNISEIIACAGSSDSWEKTAKIMMTINGFGGSGFMTKEILIDTTYTGFWGRYHEEPNELPLTFPRDWDTWTPIGPGALRGAARVSGNYAGKPFKNEQAMEVIMQLHHLQDSFFEHNFKLSPTDIQFGLCEFDKYERVRLGQGRPRSRYHAS